MTEIEDKAGNLILTPRAGEFEIVRTIILERLIRPQRDGGGSGRSVSYHKETDNRGNIDHDIIRLKNWNAVTQDPSNQHYGTCNATINIYRTTSKIMINGRDAQPLKDRILALLHDVSSWQEATDANNNIRATLMKAEDAMGSSEQSINELQVGTRNDGNTPGTVSKIPVPTPKTPKSETKIPANALRHEHESTKTTPEKAPQTAPTPNTPKTSIPTPNAPKNEADKSTLTMPLQILVNIPTSPKHTATAGTANSVEIDEDVGDYIGMMCGEPPMTVNTNDNSGDDVDRADSTDGITCGVCSEVLDDYTEIVMCDICESLLHPECESLNEHEAASQQVKASYICKSCQLLVNTSDSTPESSDHRNDQQQKNDAENSEPENHPVPKQTAKLSAGKSKQTTKSKKTLLKTDTPIEVETANAKMLEDEREKQLKKKEKAMEKRETAIKRAEMELSEQTQQIAALKSFATQLEIKIKTAEEENRLLKIQLLAQTNTTYDEKKETYERSPTKTCNQDIATTQLLTTIASLTQTVATLTLRIDSLAGKVDGKSREEGMRESQYPATSYKMPTLQDYNQHTRAERFEKEAERQGTRESHYPATSYEMSTPQDYNHHTRAEHFEMPTPQDHNQTREEHTSLQHRTTHEKQIKPRLLEAV